LLARSGNIELWVSKEEAVKTSVSIAVAGLAISATVAVAQPQIPVPDFNRTFSSASLTRGFWFEAPLDFRIVAVQVPDETGHGMQNFSIIKFRNNTPPPVWSSTTNDITIEEYVVGEDSSRRIPVDVEVFSGEVIGVLGAAGDFSIMHNSYALPGAFQSEVLGRPTTLTRAGMQFNLATTMPMAIWQEPANEVSRVFVYVEELGGTCICDEFDTASGIGVCDIFDFLGFQDAFVQGDPRACDLDTSSGSGVCDIFDFLAFQDLFVQGCP